MLLLLLLLRAAGGGAAFSAFGARHPPAWTVPEAPGDLGARAFYEQHVAARAPVVLRGAAAAWPAVATWTVRATW